MKNNNTEKTAYEQLKEKLDDPVFAQKFFDEKEAEAKFLIYDILAVTMGWSVVTEKGDDWACRSLCKVLDMFMIRHKNFERSQFAENLQMHIFNYTMKYQGAFNEWIKGWKIEDTLNEANNENQEESQSNQPIKGENKSDAISDALAEHTFGILANKVGYVLSSEKVSDDIKNAVIGVMYAASNEAGVGFDENPGIAKASVPVIMRSLGFSAQRAFIHSIEHLLEASLPESVNDELKQFEVRFDTKKPHDYDAPEKNQGLDHLAELLSKVMKHPEIPANLYNALSGELIEIPADTDSPEWILANLKKWSVQNEN